METEDRVYISIDGSIIPVTKDELSTLDNLYAETAKWSAQRQDADDFKMYASKLVKKYKDEEIRVNKRYYAMFGGVSSEKLRRVTSRNKGHRFL